MKEWRYSVGIQQLDHTLNSDPEVKDRNFKAENYTLETISCYKTAKKERGSSVLSSSDKRTKETLAMEANT